MTFFHIISARFARTIAVELAQLKGLIMATAAEANAKLDQLGATLDKISGETTGLVTEVRDLKEAAQNGGVSADVMAKIDSLVGKAESIDSLVDDVAPNPTETPADDAPASASDVNNQATGDKQTP